MLKHIMRLSYWLGLSSTVISIGWRVLVWFKALPPGLTSGPHSITYKTLLSGATLFFVIAIATAAYAWLERQAE